jgi:hypothetical protein
MSARRLSIVISSTFRGLVGAAFALGAAAGADPLAGADALDGGTAGFS